jgi:hypothetical protein
MPVADSHQPLLFNFVATTEFYCAVEHEAFRATVRLSTRNHARVDQWTRPRNSRASSTQGLAAGLLQLGFPANMAVPTDLSSASSRFCRAVRHGSGG